MSEKQSLLLPENDELAVSVNVTPATSGFTTINCQICSAVISLEGKHTQHVVKCQHCREATPIKSAPPGKRYVRCSCNCLLISKSTAARVACPRENCRRVISMTPTSNPVGPSSSGYGATSTSATPATANSAAAPGQVLCLCGHCGAPFAVSASNSQSQLARCGHCGRKSSVGPHYARRRFLAYLTAAVMFVAAMAISIAFTCNKATHGTPAFFVLYVGLLILAVVMLVRSCIFCRTKISIVESTGIGV